MKIFRQSRWAIVEKNADDYHLLEKGVNIFQEGVKIEKSWSVFRDMTKKPWQKPLNTDVNFC